MPISYSEENKGWFLDNPTEEELKQVQEIGVQELTTRFAASFMQHMVESSEEVPEGTLTN